MFQTIINAWKIADLRKKLLYTALVLLIFRIGAALPVPFVDIAENGIIADPNANNFMTYLSMMTGDAFNYGTLFAMSITPYINASIIIQLLTVAIPPLERLAKEGEEGRKKISTITRFTAVALAALQSTAYYFYIRSQGYLTTGTDGAALTGFFAVFQALVIILCYTAGAALLMWLGEQINDKGIGNGISIILFAGIVSRMPTLQPLHLHQQRRRVFRADSDCVCLHDSDDRVHRLDGQRGKKNPRAVCKACCRP